MLEFDEQLSRLQKPETQYLIPVRNYEKVSTRLPKS